MIRQNLFVGLGTDSNKGWNLGTKAQDSFGPLAFVGFNDMSVDRFNERKCYDSSRATRVLYLVFLL